MHRQPDCPDICCRTLSCGSVGESRSMAAAGGRPHLSPSTQRRRQIPADPAAVRTRDTSMRDRTCRSHLYSARQCHFSVRTLRGSSRRPLGISPRAYPASSDYAAPRRSRSAHPSYTTRAPDPPAGGFTHLGSFRRRPKMMYINTAQSLRRCALTSDTTAARSHYANRKELIT